MRVVVNWNLCEGNGACVVAAPELFAVDDNDQLVVLKEEPPEADRQKLLRAVASCPKRALRIEG